jgi:hypothetical protein
MGNGMSRYAIWAVVAMLVVTIFASISSVQATSPNYTLSGYVEQPGGSAMLQAGVTVDLVNSATHQTLTATTTRGGLFSYTTASTSGALVPGWWGLWVPPQTGLQLGGHYQWVALPSGSVPSYYYLNASILTSTTTQYTTTASVAQMQSVIEGNATFASGGPAAEASVNLTSPSYPGFAINTTTTNGTGHYSFHVPEGTWFLSTVAYGSTILYNTTPVTISSGANTITENPVIGGYVAYGNIYLKGSTGTRVSSGGNVTIYNTGTGAIQSEPTLPGAYSIGTYPGSFVVLVSPWGYGTVAYPLTVASGSAPVVQNLYVSPRAPPAQYNTTLAFTSNFTNLTATTSAKLWNDSVFPSLPNGTVGQLWSQLGLDFNGGSLSFPAGASSQSTAFLAWLASQGPFFGAGEAGLLVNGTTFGQPANYSYTAPTIPAGPLNYASTTAPLSVNWSQHYNATTSVAGGGVGRTYTIAFGFRYPTGPESINYTVDLPAGYALAANTVKPANSNLYPAGTGGTWTNFTLSPHPVAAGSSTFGSANFTVVKYGSITANVNISTAYFAYSGQNVLNSTHSNYEAVVGLNQNVTFSAINSTYPDGTNGSVFHWNFGGSTKTTTTPTSWFTYTTPGVYHGSVSVLSSGGRTSQANFTVFVGNAKPTVKIASNATAAQMLTGGGSTPYLLVNWSTPLQFNVTGSVATLASNITQDGVLSDAVWSVSSLNYNSTANYTASSGAKVNSNFTVNFLGAGHYIKVATIGGTAITLNGWWYNVTLTLWNGQGQSGTATLAVLVKDTQKPVSVLTLRDTKGTNISSAGLVEGTNHTAGVEFDAQYSYDPNNGSLSAFNWSLSNPSNTTWHLYKNTTSSAYWLDYLAPEPKPYSVNLTVWSLAGTQAWTVENLSITINVTTRPVLVINNLTAPATVTDGSSYTIWANLTNTVGKSSVAENVTVLFYLLKTGQTGIGTVIGSGNQVKFYNYTSGAVDSTPIATGVLPTLAYNATVRVQFSWTPGITGSYNLFANASATNEFSGSVGPNVASTPVTLNANPIQQDYLYAEIGGVAVAVIIVIVFYVGYWRPRHTGSSRTSSTSRSGLSRGSGSKKGSSDSTTKDKDEKDDQ